MPLTRACRPALWRGVGDKYHVEMCEPAVPGIDLLLSELNGGNDFSKFVRDVRRGFKVLVA